MAEVQTSGAAITFDKLGKSFDKRGSGTVMALEDVNLDVAPGIIALCIWFGSVGGVGGNGYCAGGASGCSVQLPPASGTQCWGIGGGGGAEAG